MAVRGCTFHLQTMTSKDWAHQINNFHAGMLGVTKGCIASVRSDGKIGLSAGYFFIFGRQLEEDGTSIITVPAVASTTYRALVYELDMRKENTKTAFNQGTFRILSSVGAYPVLIQEDLNNGGNVYQFQFAAWKQEISGITNFNNSTRSGVITGYVQPRNIAQTYERDSYYNAGDYVYANGQLYRCKTAIRIEADTFPFSSPEFDIITLANEVQQLIKREKDWIIEADNTPNGYYEKWNSGKLIMWGQQTIASGTLTANGSTFTALNGIILPITSLTNVTAFVDGSNNFGATVSLAPNLDMKSQVGIQLLRASSGSFSMPINYYAIGTWK